MVLDLILVDSDGLVVNSGVLPLPLMTSDARDRTAVSRAFWIGPENALLRVLLDAGGELSHYGPVTVYGPTGSGKTHVLQGVVNRASVTPQAGKCWSTTGADFSRQYARAVELDGVTEFRERWQTARLVVVDGLEELSGKGAAQQEFLQLLDDCIAAGRQLLCACRFSPHEWSWMLPGLRSRLASGLIIPIALPEPHTRVAILTELVSACGVAVSHETIQSMANRPSGQVGSLATYSQLRSAVLALACEAADAGGDPTRDPDGVDGHGTGPASHAAGPQAAVRRIVRLVARHVELPVPELLGASRRRSVVQARGVAIYLARSLLGISFQQLGRSFGQRDHTTILHAFRKTEAMLGNDPVLKQTIDRLRNQLTTLAN
jgi:chromosomal replication initiator protein